MDKVFADKSPNTIERWERSTGLKAKLPAIMLIPANKERDSSGRYMFCLSCRNWILVEYWYGHFEAECAD